MRTDRSLISEKNPTIIWEPPNNRVAESNLIHFMKIINQDYHLQIDNYQQLHQWSIENPEAFWAAFWDQFKPLAHQDYASVLESGDSLQHYHWFTESRFNLAENLVCRGQPEQTALVFHNEQGIRHAYTFEELKQHVTEAAKGLIADGVEPGDRIAAVAPNIPQTVITMLAALAIGAVWSCVPPEYDEHAIAERLEVIDPKLLFVADGYMMEGKSYDHLASVQVYQERLDNLEATYVFSYIEQEPDIKYLEGAHYYENLLKHDSDPIKYAILPFDHPAYIVFSSGAAHAPRAVTHPAGGVLLQHAKELMLHAEISNDDLVFFDARPGDPTWYWTLSALAQGATVSFYDGSIYYPEFSTLLQLAEREQFTVLGIRPSYLNSLEKLLYAPNDFYKLNALKTVLSAQGPLLTRNIEYVYEDIKDDVRVSSLLITADTLCCMALDQPMAPVTRGEYMHLPLGMDISVYTPEGDEAALHEKGELVCRQPFPSMPLYLLDDPQNKQFNELYLSKYGDVWCQGDLVEVMENATLVYQGRMETAISRPDNLIGVTEIYRHSQKLDEVVENAAVGFSSQGEEKIILFVRLKPKLQINEEIRARINGFIRLNATESHVPWVIIQTQALPKTHDGKVSEVAIKNTLNSQPLTNLAALADPDELDFYKKLVNQQIKSEQS